MIPLSSRAAVAACLPALALGAVLVLPYAARAQSDPYVWLEDVNGERALSWVRAEDAKTLAVLAKDPRFPELYSAALAIDEAKDRIPSPEFLQKDVYNFWQDAAHVRGIWRKTALAEYQQPNPDWETVLDLDALAKAENANWFFQGADCLWPDQNRCLISLSDGGEDASTVREFDLDSRAFVKGGFDLPRGKQSVAWENDDTILVAREWNPGELTESGYPFIVKRLKRGAALSSAVELFRGSKSDVGTDPFVVHDGDGHSAAFVTRNVTFFTSETYLVGSNGLRKLALPPKAGIDGMVAGRILIEPKENWNVGGSTFPAGSLVSVQLDALAADPDHPKPTLVFAPGPREALEDVETAKSCAVAVVNENVRGRAYAFAPGATGWTKRRLDLPDNASIAVASSSEKRDDLFLTVTGFLTPTTLVLADLTSGTIVTVKASPPRFDASKDVVEQFESTSRDGTKIPYFIVHPKTMTLDGNNPTILYGYGGFSVSLTPYYSGILGKLWLERGGVFVLANIRGGGEFGPAWHEAALKTNRQRAFDDFASVAQDLIARKITSPRRLGIQGGSNGGLLMGVEFVQHPALFNAVDIQVPLLDMLRYEKLAAGASWIGEYGSVSNPTERAFLASISPYENLQPGVKYPQALIWTTTKDDRVGPQQARKFAAKLSAMGVPYLFYEVVEGGHALGANLNEQAHTSALEFMYFIQKLMD